MSDNCPDCNAVPGAFHTPMCGARDSGAYIWVGTHGVPALEAQISVLREELDQALARIGALEAQTPQVQQLQYEADLAAADLAETGYYYDGPCCADPGDDDGYDPGPECDDQGGMSEYRFTVIDGEQPS